MYIHLDIFPSSVAQKLKKLDLDVPQEHFLIPIVDIKDGLVFEKRFLLLNHHVLLRHISKLFKTCL